MASIFCDLDGVLCDFDAGCLAATGKLPYVQMWSILARTPNFYGSLPWMSDGKVLWDAIAPLQPTILTGIPRGKWAETQKQEWCTRELGPSVAVICCKTIDKHTFGKRGDILIDDRPEKAREPWESIGGVFVHHVSAEQTLTELRKLGVL